MLFKYWVYDDAVPPSASTIAMLRCFHEFGMGTRGLTSLMSNEQLPYMVASQHWMHVMTMFRECWLVRRDQRRISITFNTETRVHDCLEWCEANAYDVKHAFAVDLLISSSAWVLDVLPVVRADAVVARKRAFRVVMLALARRNIIGLASRDILTFAFGHV